VVSDFVMPELNGLEFYDALVAGNPRLASRVIFLTGAARDCTGTICWSSVACRWSAGSTTRRSCWTVRLAVLRGEG
jgi:hypothetical protein